MTWKMRCASATVGVAALGLSLVSVSAQNPNWDGQRFTRLLPNMAITVRTTESIDISRVDRRVFYGVVEQDVRGDNGRLAIPRGSHVELIARSARNGDLVLDMESVDVNGVRYAVSTDPARSVGTTGADDIVGSIAGAITGGAVRGRQVRVPRNTVITFRLDRPLDMNVADRGIDRNGNHYHDWYDRGRQ